MGDEPKVCKIDHSDPEALPEALCVRCHPELLKTPEQIAALDAADAERRRLALARARKERDLDRTKLRLASLERRERRHHGLCALDEKVKTSLEQKAQRLQEELKECETQS